ncbi:MAG: hypothetical protein WD378_02100 [Egicoccus sp.]
MAISDHSGGAAQPRELQQTQGLAGSPATSRRTLAQLPHYDAALASDHGITDDILSLWDPRFDIDGLIVMRAEGIGPSQAARWPARFNGHDIVALEGTGTDPDDQTPPIEPDQTARWPDRFTGGDIVVLYAAGIEPDIAAEYPRRFTGADIERLVEAHVEPTTAASYPTWTLAVHITAAVERRISPEELAALAGGEWGLDDPDWFESTEQLRQLLGPQMLPISELDRIRPRPEPPGGISWL